MHKYENEFRQIKDLIEKATNIAIISHKNPDGDTIGANLALTHALRSVGKNAISFAKDPAPAATGFLPGVSNIRSELNPSEFDLFIALDCGAAYMMRYEIEHPELLDRSQTTLINIDHHPSNEHFGNVNVVDPEASATSALIYFLIESLGILINRDIATCLMNGLYSDTGSFKHSNTDPITLKIASNLVARGADFRTIVKKQFHHNRINQLRLWGRVLSRTRINEKGATVSAVMEKDFEELGATPEDLSGVIDYINSVPGSKFCILLAEDQKGNIKGSFRTQDDMIDLSKIAGLFGGGGHKKAAGFTIPGKIEQEVVWKIRPSA